MPFFGAEYTLRQYGEDTVINGYPAAGYKDTAVFLDVQVMSGDEVVEAGGSRDRMMLEAFGDVPVRTSRQEDGIRSDELLYEGRWFKCISSHLNRNTVLKHWDSVFELIPSSTNPAPDPPETEAEE